MKFYYTYVLRSLKDSNIYIGWTNNSKTRLIKHNSGKIRSTKSRKPFELVYYEACSDRHKAILREKQFKTGFGRKFLKSRI